MFVRFVTHELCPESGQRLGIFHALRYARDDGELTTEELAVANEQMAWFDQNLESPLHSLNRQRAKHSGVLISWFKPGAQEHIRRARLLTELLRGKDILVETLKTARPGKIVYEDEHQIFAQPFTRY